MTFEQLNTIILATLPESRVWCYYQERLGFSQGRVKKAIFSKVDLFKFLIKSTIVEWVFS